MRLSARCWSGAGTVAEPLREDAAGYWSAPVVSVVLAERRRVRKNLDAVALLAGPALLLARRL